MIVSFDMLQTALMEWGRQGSCDLLQDFMASFGGTCTTTIRVPCLFSVCQAGALTYCDTSTLFTNSFLYVACLQFSSVYSIPSNPLQV